MSSIEEKDYVFVEYCGNSSRTIKIYRNKPNRIKIGCTSYTESQAIEAIKSKYDDFPEERDKYIKKVKECFKLARKEYGYWKTIEFSKLYPKIEINDSFKHAIYFIAAFISTVNIFISSMNLFFARRETITPFDTYANFLNESQFSGNCYIGIWIITLLTLVIVVYKNIKIKF